MVAGDLALQTEIMYDLMAIIHERITSEPQNWWRVRDVADLYVNLYSRARRKAASNQVLSPLGLDSDTFISRQKEMSPELVRQLATELINFDLSSSGAIFAGIDASGPHLYVAEDGNVTCRDVVGFAAIGAGDWHARSTFMFARYTRATDIPRALFLTFSAKKRAEIAPGVGPETDMLWIGPQLGSHIAVRTEIVDDLNRIYQRNMRRNRTAVARTEEEVKAYVEKIITTSAASEKQDPSAPLDGKAAADTAATGGSIEKREGEEPGGQG